MPKSSKKKKEKAADFSKARLKLGKGKQTATNAIDTTFKARSIALPQQSIVIQKDASTPITKRRLSFDDLLAHLKHYSAGVRRDAIQGVRELFEGYPELIEPSLTNLIGACVRLIGDEDANVRKMLLAFFSWLLPRVPSVHLVPHAPLLLLFMTSAQTHIFPEIRIDAIRFLDLLLEIMPEQVVSGWTQSGENRAGHGTRVLDGYLGLLNAGSRFGEDSNAVQAVSASAMLTPASQRVIFDSLSTFLRHVTSRERLASTSSTPGNLASIWFLAASFSSSESFTSFAGLLHPIRTSSSAAAKSVTWLSAIDLETTKEDFAGHFHLAGPLDTCDTTFQDLSDVISDITRLAQMDTHSYSANAQITHMTVSLCRTLHPILISTFLDCAPAVFSPTIGSPATETNLILSIGRIAHYLYGSLMTDENVTKQSKDIICESLNSVLNHMAPYFPFGEYGFSSQDMKTEQAFQELNLIYCELSSLLALTYETPQENTTHGPKSVKPRQTKKNGATVTPAGIVKQMAVVSDYVVRCLRGEVKSASNPMGQRLTPMTYVGLLPTLWSLVNDFATSSTLVWTALLEHGMRVSSTSALKRGTIEFIAHLVLLQTEPQYKGSFRIGCGLPADSKAQEWILHLPRTLWELGTESLPTTEVILLFLLRLFQRQSWLSNQETLTSVRSRLLPFFSVQHRTRGEILGPYTKLPTASLRRLALDVASVLSPLENSDECLCTAVEKATTGTEEYLYWKELSER